MTDEQEGFEFAEPAPIATDEGSPSEEPEEDIPYRELQGRARDLGISAGGSKEELSQRILDEEVRLAAAAERERLEEQYGPFIVNLWHGIYPNFGCPAAGCEFLVLGDTREDGEAQIAAHYSASHVPAGPAALASGLLGPDGRPLA